MKSYIVMVVGNDISKGLKVRYAAPNGGGTEFKAKAQKFPSNAQAHEVRREIQTAIGNKAVASVLEVE